MFLDAIASRFGGDAHLSEGVRRQYGRSEAHFPEALPDAVIVARATRDVVDCIRLCAAHDVPVIAFGAGTSIEGNALAVHGGVSLDMSQMNRIIGVNADDFDCTVEAGVRREQLNAHLRDTGLFFPIDPGADATIAGMAATRASGTNAVRYGTMRDAVLSLTIVTADGNVIRTARRARKSAAGYDLTRLFVGSEGTLGVITEVTLRLHPVPETVAAAVCGFATLQGAVDTVVQSIQGGVALARVELLDDRQIAAVNIRSKLDLPEINTLFFEFHGSPAGVAEQIGVVRDIAAANGGGAFAFADRPEERARLWKARHEAYYAAVNIRPDAVGWTTDVCVPIASLVDCILATRADLDTCTVPATILGHVGDGNFHVIFSIDPNAPAEFAEVEAVNRRLVERALAMDGTCTGEHGIGLGKQDWLVAELSDAVDLMRMLKRALDPKNLMNPGKIFSL
jgi:D-lactate dehydrogenase (cytochrome)